MQQIPHIPRRPLVISDPVDVTAALLEIDGLTESVLMLAVEDGERARQNCTSNDPITAPGTLFYYNTVRSLRDQLLPRWSKKCDSGSELTVSPSGKHAIIVAGGDQNVGSLHRDPRTRRKKGNRTRRAARVNVFAFQQDLFDLMTDEDLRVLVDLGRRKASMITHMLLAHRTEDRLVIELSAVAGLDEEGHASEWAQRIIVGNLQLDGSPISQNSSEPTPDFEVSVTRRTA